MPSGAKKRKAAKRRKEMGISHPPDSLTNPPSHPGNGVRNDEDRTGNCDEKESEVGSPMSQGTHSLTEQEGEEEGEKEDRPESGGIAVDRAIESLENGGEVVKQGVLSKNGDVIVDFFQAENVNEGSKKVELEKLAEVNIVPIEQSVLVTEGWSQENPEALVDGFGSSSHDDGGVEVLADAARTVVDPITEKLDPVERSLVTEGVSKDSQAPDDNPEAFVGGIDASSHGKEKGLIQSDETDDAFPDAARSEIEPRVEVARVPLMEHRASLWNCCGFLECLTGSQR